MDKRAEVITPLQPHQREALRRALAGNLVLAHSTGSGKTLTSIAAADAIGRPTVVLTPASLVENYRKELAKHTRGGPEYTVMSLPTAVRQNFEIPEGATLVVDEAHSARNLDTERAAYLRHQADRAGRVLALTGTPAYNDPADYAGLLSLVAPRGTIPRDSAKFRDRYIGQRITWDMPQYGPNRSNDATVTEYLRTSPSIGREVGPYIDVFRTDVEKPTRVDHTVTVPLPSAQYKTYLAVMGRMPAHLRRKLLRNLPPTRAESAQMNAFLTAVRQVANTAEGYDTTAAPGAKIVEASSRLAKAVKANPQLRALVYSNYLDSGVNAYARELDRMGIPYGTFTGALSPKAKAKLVDDYNAGRLRALLVSGSGSEGLDLKRTNLIQILEPHWNDSRIDQVIGRGIRYRSHDGLPKAQRRVDVERYISTLPPGKGTSVDEYLTTRSREKAALMAKMLKAIQKGAPRPQETNDAIR